MTYTQPTHYPISIPSALIFWLGESSNTNIAITFTVQTRLASGGGNKKPQRNLFADCQNAIFQLN